jgi:hypothetical protein
VPEGTEKPNIVVKFDSGPLAGALSAKKEVPKK